MTRTLRVALAVLVTLAASSCGGDDKQQARPSTPVKISIVAPEAGAVIDEPMFEVRVDLPGGKIVPEASRDLTPTTEGHLHVSVDGAILSQTYGLTQELESPDPGRHLLQVEFVAKDHGPFEPRVIASVPFEVRDGS